MAHPAGPPALVVGDIPSSSTLDDLTIMVSQFTPVKRILMSAPGTRGGLGTALVLLCAATDAADVQSVAELLDCHPMAGGLVSVAVCEDVGAWIGSSMLGDELLGLLHFKGSASYTNASKPIDVPFPLLPSPNIGRAAAETQLDSSAWLPHKPADAGSSAHGSAAVRLTATTAARPNGAEAYEADLLALQQQLQGQAEAQPAEGSDGWGWTPGEGFQHRTPYDMLADSGEDGLHGGAAELGASWQQSVPDTASWHGAGGSSTGGSEAGDGWRLAGTSPAPRRESGAGGRVHRSSGTPAKGGAEDDGRGKIIVRHILQPLQQQFLKQFFRRFGWVTELIKFPEVQYCFVHFADDAAAVAAMRQLDGEVVPELNPQVALSVQRRTMRASPAAASAGNDAASEATPAAKLWVGNLAPHATIDALTSVFGRYGAVYDLTLQKASNGGHDQWGFVRFRSMADAQRAFEELRWSVLPQLTGKQQLKLNFRHD